MSLNDDVFNLTTFDGGKDRTGARRVQEALGAGNIRTRVVDNMDGSQSIHRMRAGWPEVITTYADNSEEASSYLRGYISNIRSRTMDVLNTIWAAIIGKTVSGWRKKQAATIFGAYTVSNASQKEGGDKDVWVIKQNVLSVFRSTIRKSKQLFGDVSGLPFVLFPGEVLYEPGISDEDDLHVFAIGAYSVKHAAWRNTEEAIEIYNSNELSAGTTGFPTVFSAGPCFGLEKSKVGYAETYISNVGNVMQRARSLALKSTSPYFDLGELVDHTTQGFIYLYPSGTTRHESSSGSWKKPVPPLDVFIWEEYVKSGGPYPAQGTLVWAGYKEADYAVNTSASSADATIYEGRDSYAFDRPVGWFGEDLSVSVSVEVTASHTAESSSGEYAMVSPADVAYGGYGSASEPPAIHRQWFGPNYYAAPVTTGAHVLTASSGYSNSKYWVSVSRAEATLMGAPLLAITYTSSGQVEAISGRRYQANGAHPFDGVAVNFTSPENPYAAQWDAQIFCQYSATGDQYNPGYIMDQVTFSESSSSSSKSLMAETRDYILFDKINDRYVYLKGVFSGGDSGSTMSLSVVVKIGNVEHEKQLRFVASSEFSWLIPEEQAWQECYYWNPPCPYSGFSPPFCNQGYCRFVAYSEAHEGGEPAFLLSLPLVLQEDPIGETTPETGYAFIPRNFRAVLGFAGMSLLSPFWSGFTNKITVINFADGAFTDWVSGIYPAATSDTTTFSEIYRT